MSSQEVFRTAYRGRQTPLHHVAYLRMSKVLLARYLLSAAAISLQGKTIFDYGFGAGTFFRYCPPTAALSGVEIDPVAVREVQQMCVRRGHKEVQLQPIEVEHWKEHRLLQKQYDVFLCSHVLEHLIDPLSFLRRAAQCLTANGVFVGLVPINELQQNIHHVQTVDRCVVKRWMAECGLRLQIYLEADPWNYWVQPLFTSDEGSLPKWRHLGAQAFSLMVGIPATLIGPRGWMKLSRWFGRLTFSKPSQAAFLASRP